MHSRKPRAFNNSSYDKSSACNFSRYWLDMQEKQAVCLSLFVYYLQKFFFIMRHGDTGTGPCHGEAGVLFRQLIPQEGISFLIYTFGLSPSLNHFLFHLTISPKSCRKVSFPIITAYLNARKSLLILIRFSITGRISSVLPAR